jgi:hypothetical protein
MPFFLLLATGLYALRNEVFADQIISYIVLGLLAVVLKTVYFSTVFLVFDLRPMPPGLLAARLGASPILGIVTVPLVYFAVSALCRTWPKHRRVW